MEHPELLEKPSQEQDDLSEFQDLLEPQVIASTPGASIGADGASVKQTIPKKPQDMSQNWQDVIRDRDWLLGACAQHVAQFMPDSGLEAKQLTEDIFDLLRSKREGTSMIPPWVL